MKPPASIVARIKFADGDTHDVWDEPGGRQYVFDPAARKVYGVWFIPPEETVQPIIVEEKRTY